MTEQAVRPKNSYYLTRSIFIRFLGIIYFIAFVSLSSQIVGLIGSHGILPIEKLVKAYEQHFGANRYFVTPTVFWWNASDAALRGVCALGAVLSVFVVVGVAQGFCLSVLWVLYLSIVGVGQDFLSFQWDIFLLEVGFLAMFFASWQIIPRRQKEDPPSIILLWLLRWVLFRLMFESGLVKLVSGDQTWHDLTALTYHYWTQPIPNPFSWYAHQMPVWFHKFSCAIMFFIELLSPFLIFCGQKGKIAAFFLISGLQIIILTTGNYCFFNLLTIALCLLLLDDNFFKKLYPKWLIKEALPIHTKKNRFIFYTKRVATIIFAVYILTVSSSQLFARYFGAKTLPKPVLLLIAYSERLNSINNYGLFAMMTRERNEIVIEGSDDGIEWKTYEFKWKPGDVKRAPSQVAPHQPRLDWQMWFAALGNFQSSTWFIPLLVRLFENEPAVTALLSHNPFPAHPPKYLRAQFYRYHFTDWKTHHATGAWWEREYKGLYFPVVMKE